MESVRRLVRDFGSVDIVDTTRKTQPLKDGSADLWALIEKAETFRFAGSRYNRAEFEKLLGRMIAKPGQAEQINLPDWLPSLLTEQGSVQRCRDAPSW